MQEFPTKRPMHAYIIRLWAEFDGSAWVWRVSLKPTLSSESALGFCDLQTAVEHLLHEMKQAELDCS